MFLWNALPVGTSGKSAVKHCGQLEVTVLPDFAGKSDIRKTAGRASNSALLLHCESLRIMV
jgi:hypothetical protein